MLPNFDPSRMDPKLLMELSELIRQLPPEKIQRMQTLMHNMMAGFDVRREMDEFEKDLPPGFREKVVLIMGRANAAPAAAPAPSSQASPEMSIREARLTLLRAVAEGQLSPEEAEKLLFRA